MTSRALRALAIAFALSLSGCTMTKYVTQAAAGQDDLERRAVPIQVLLDGNHVNARLHRLLAEVAVVKAFGEEHGLRPTPNYTTYVRLDRPAVTWGVSACDPLAFRPKSWSFPIVGGFTFLNWFHKSDAESFAKDLTREGWDVDMRGVSAYSTAGWFYDPMLSSMVPTGEEALGRMANVVLHESTHATLFFPGQSAMNESIANFVGDHMSVLYMQERVGPDARETRAYVESERRGDERVLLLHQAYERLNAVYTSKSTRDEKLAQKAVILRELQAKLRFPRPINNATVMQYRTYNSGQGELAELLRVCDGSYPRFIATLARLKEKKHAQGQSFAIGSMVESLTREGCAPAP